jgi:hypothetical protein
MAAHLLVHAGSGAGLPSSAPPLFSPLFAQNLLRILFFGTLAAADFL